MVFIEDSLCLDLDQALVVQSCEVIAKPAQRRDFEPSARLARVDVRPCLPPRIAPKT
ncbi:hypothetical protein D3C84_1015030 [compost metagenome]